MSKIGKYQPPEKYKNYSLPTGKPFKSHMFYKEKVLDKPEQIFLKLKKVAEFLEHLYPSLTSDISKNIKVVIEKNLETLVEDLHLMQSGLDKNPYAFNTNQLKTNQHCITEMKNVCDTLQTVSSFEHEFKRLSKIKHALHELEHIIQPSNFEEVKVKSKPKTVAAKKERVLVGANKKVKEKSTVSAKKPKVISKKSKPATALVKAKKAVTKKSKPTTALVKAKKAVTKKPTKAKVPALKLKQSTKKVTKPKELAKSKIKSPAALKMKSAR